MLGRFLGPTTLSRVPGFCLSMTANAVDETTEGNDFLLILDVLEEADSTLQRHTLDGTSRLVGVLEVDTEVVTASLARLGVVFWFGTIVDLSHYHCWLTLK